MLNVLLDNRTVDPSVAVMMLAEAGARLDYSEPRYQVPAVIAARKEFVQSFDYLLAKNAPIRDGIFAIGKNVHIAEEILKRGANPNQVTDFFYNRTKLFQDDVTPEVAEMLVKFGGSPTFQDKDGNTPLHFFGTPEKFKILALLKLGAPINIANNEGQTALMYWLSHNCAPAFNNCTLVDAALKYSSNLGLQVKNHEGVTALAMLIQASNIQETDDQDDSDLKRIKVFVNLGADINAKDNSGNTPLAYAKEDRLRNFLISLGAK